MTACFGAAPLRSRLFFALLSLYVLLPSTRSSAAETKYHEILVVDRATGFGVPLVELETTFHTRHFTDSAGRVAFHEPGLMDKELFFYVRSHGYEAKADGFGYRGTRLVPQPGGKTIIELQRLNIAERLCRLTGAGIYQDTVLLGQRAPISKPLINADVVGQDSAQAVIYNGKARWFWGDTAFYNYPLGNFRTTGATLDLARLNPAHGLDFRYFTDENGRSRQMAPFEPKEGVVWIDGLCVVEDRMLARFTRLRGLGHPLEQGLVLWNDQSNEFERFASFPLTNAWRKPLGQALTFTNDGSAFIYFCAPFPNVRVKASLQAIRDPSQYEAWTPLKEGAAFRASGEILQRDRNGALEYRWTTKAPPLFPKEENELFAKGILEVSDLRTLPADLEGGKRPVMHGGSVRWNEFRQRFIFIGNEIGGSSMLGEVWCAEASRPTGPWKRARKIATHNHYDFYNPVHHSFLDQAGGRQIHFEGTYTFTFSGQTNATPRYEYNQLLYRLDLADERLNALREP